MSKTYVRVKDGEVTQRSTKPTVDNLSSAHLLSDEQLAEYGWLPLVSGEEPVLGFDDYVSGTEYVIQETQVIQNKVVTKRTLTELKVILKQRAKSFIEQKLSEEFGVFEGFARALGLLGATAKTQFETRLNDMVVAYNQFAGEVDSTTTKAELKTVYDNYPQLHEEI